MTTSTTPSAWEPSLRYPDPSVQILDKSFAKYRLPLAGVERLRVRPAAEDRQKRQ